MDAGGLARGSGRPLATEPQSGSSVARCRPDGSGRTGTTTSVPAKGRAQRHPGHSHRAVGARPGAQGGLSRGADRPTATSGGLAKSPAAWRAEFKRSKGARTGDVFFEPAWVETGRPFHVLVRYDDGSTAETDFRGQTADHKLRVAAVALAARWIGQDRQDRTGAGPSVGPDGFQDARIHLSGLSTKLTSIAIRISGPGGPELGDRERTPSCSRRAELIRDPKDPSQARPFLSADPRPSRTAAQAHGGLRERSARLDHGHRRPVRPKLRVTHPPLPNLPVVTAHGSLAGPGWCKSGGAGRRSRHAFGAAERRPRSRARSSATRSEGFGSIDANEPRAGWRPSRPALPFVDQAARRSQVDRRVLPAVSRREQEHDDAQADLPPTAAARS